MTAIEFNNISKQYRLGLVSTRTLSHDLNRWWTMNVRGKDDPYLKIGDTNDRTTKGESDYVWALRDIDFKVEQGDVLGIIGKNGAGKSTLLKILSKVTTPTTGTIKARGRIASLLEVGTGFHPEMTGRENIYMNGAIMGMTKAEISRKLDEIVDFSGCERYLDTPVKRYSSGMTVRLGFAIAAHLDPEILVVDEVLAVGDAEFQKKAIGKMQDVSRGEGRTVLFVSHNMAAVKNLCTSGIWLQNGMVYKTGNIDNLVRDYLTEDIPDRQFDLSSNTKFIGNGLIKVGQVSISSINQPNGCVINNQQVSLKVELINSSKLKGVIELAGTIKTTDNEYVHYFSSKLNSKVYFIDGEETYSIVVEFDEIPLVSRKYILGLEIKYNSAIVYSIEKAIVFDVVEGDYYQSGILNENGIVLLKQSWK